MPEGYLDIRLGVGLKAIGFDFNGIVSDGKCGEAENALRVRRGNAFDAHGFRASGHRGAAHGPLGSVADAAAQIARGLRQGTGKKEKEWQGHSVSHDSCSWFFHRDPNSKLRLTMALCGAPLGANGLKRHFFTVSAAGLVSTMFPLTMRTSSTVPSAATMASR